MAFLQSTQWKPVSDYRVISMLGEGSYGTVVSARKVSNLDEIVAIKKMNDIFQHPSDALRVYREMRLLSRLNHPCIVNLVDARTTNTVCNGHVANYGHLYLIFGLMETDLDRLIQSDYAELSMDQIKDITAKIFCGLRYLHSANVIHRDIKPANILYSPSTGGIKIADFGLSRVVDRMSVLNGKSDLQLNFQEVETNNNAASNSLRRAYTSHVVSRWYRAPEIILLLDYTSAVDVWSVGCVLAELFQMLESKPFYMRGCLFPGNECCNLSPRNLYANPREQLHVICRVLGTPTMENMQHLDDDAKAQMAEIGEQAPQNFEAMFPSVSAEGLQLLLSTLQFNPHRRINVDGALSHAFFSGVSMPSEYLVTSQEPFDVTVESSQEDTPERLSSSIVSIIRSFALKRNSQNQSQANSTQSSTGDSIGHVFQSNRFV